MKQFDTISIKERQKKKTFSDGMCLTQHTVVMIIHKKTDFSFFAHKSNENLG